MTELKIRKGTLTAQVSEVPVKKHQRRVKAPKPQMRRIELDEVREPDEIDDIAADVFEEEEEEKE